MWPTLNPSKLVQPNWVSVYGSSSRVDMHQSSNQPPQRKSTKYVKVESRGETEGEIQVSGNEEKLLPRTHDLCEIHGPASSQPYISASVVKTLPTDSGSTRKDTVQYMSDHGSNRSDHPPRPRVDCLVT